MDALDVPEKISPDLQWEAIDTVFLDMDGTLLDRHFDDYFWREYVPENYSLLHDISVEEAWNRLVVKFRSVAGTLDWADPHYWSRELDLDIVALKVQVNELVAVHPHVFTFLTACHAARKQLILLTNAHTSTLEVKLEKAAITGWFDRVISSADVGFAKEQPEFWPTLASMMPLDRKRSLLVDDTEKVLMTARDFGIGNLVCVARPSSRQPVRFSRAFASIEYFKEIMPG
ncbi:MAG: haloacid dehalogenase [Deltaproteobacteria bacterium]|nr:MAG: haloacid dehalogenase [Deltaproteobacteria bacterium]